ncbi:hypothetical protein NDU88_005461 [Pleurodeles waltl]|uniref:Uncharacterized protein n=1 Tax=Pleurodeles waltl TaxID=8319 RepID=A0AAV7W7W3_PLEWA|nr:hypothetical protein NDU88_005461 [Pleurodeles waltl]
MKKTDRNQTRLNFETRSSTKPPQVSLVALKQRASSQGTTSLQSALLAMQNSLKLIDGKIGILNLRMDNMSTKLNKYVAQFQTAEQRILVTEDDANGIRSKCLNMEKVLVVSQAHNEDLEACSSWNNLRITEVSESTNTGGMESFVETMLTTIFGSKNLSHSLVVEQAHRSLIARPLIGAPLHPIIAKLLNYQDRDTVSRLAYEKSEISYQGNQVAVYPTFTVAVQAAWRESLQAKTQLQKN